MKRFLMTMLALLAATFAFGNVALAQGHGNHHGGGNHGWPDSLRMITVTGKVEVDSSHFQTLYYLDTNNDGKADYHLAFGPPWYQPASGAKRPKNGDVVTVVGAVMNPQMMIMPPALVVFEINGLKWRDPIEVGGHGWNGHDMWDDHGDTLTVRGVVLIDTTYFYEHYFLDTNNDGKPDYQLGFGPPWYTPASGAKRPNAGDAVTIFGRVHDDGMMGYDMLVVYKINGLEWRPLTGPAPWGGMWMRRDHRDSLRVYCVNDSASWMHFPSGHMGMGGMGMGMWPDSVFMQLWRIHPDSLPGLHHDGHFAGFYVNVNDPQGNSMMGRQMGWGRGHMRFEKAQRFRFQYRDEDWRNLGLSENGLTVRVWNSDMQQWQNVSGVTINTSTNTVTFISADLNSYYALNAPKVVTNVDDFASGAVPEKFALEQNYPNPFNPSTTIRFALPQESLVKLEIFNVLGQKVATLVNAVRPAGEHTLQWNGVDDSGKLATSSVYLMRLQAGNEVMLRRMTLMK